MIALYVRVSTDKQTTDNQKIRVEEYAKSKGLAYHLFEETESSRKTRPVKQVMLKKARLGEYESIVVYKLDRFARSSTELILDVSDLIKKGVGFISLSENLDFTIAAGKLQFQILAAFAEFERELISERTKEGIHRAREQGKKLGRPFGSKDARPRRKGGYILKEARKRQVEDQQDGKFKPIEGYIDRER